MSAYDPCAEAQKHRNATTGKTEQFIHWVTVNYLNAALEAGRREGRRQERKRAASAYRVALKP